MKPRLPEQPESLKSVVMIVDDHPQFRRALVDWMAAAFSQAEIIEAETGEDALAFAGRRRIPIVLMDIALPGINGIEATRRIKARSPGTRVIVVTNYAVQEYRQAAQAAGACGYVIKSRIGLELEALLAPLLAEAAGSRSASEPPSAASSHGEASLEDIVRHVVGLRIRQQDLEALEAWKRERVRALGLGGGNRYETLLAGEGDAAARERELLCERFTTGESYFFRDSAQLALIKEKLLPEIIGRRARERSLRLWSAGCAAGEEAYSLAMMIDELAPELCGWKIDILGTDISSKALKKARTGLYGQWSFRGLDPGRKARYFRARGDRWAIDPRLRRMVTFARSDLVRDAFPAAGLAEFDLILCRNVFIYLDPSAIARITEKFAAALAEDGYLIAGHSELFGHNLEPLRTRVFPQSVVLQKQAPRAAELRPPPEPAPAAAAPSLPLRPVPMRPTQPAPAARSRTTGAQTVEQLMAQAWRYADRGMRDAAAEACRKAIAIAAFDPRPYYLLAQLAQEHGEAGEAKTLLKKVIYLDPAFIAAYLELGALHEHDGEDDRARRMRQAARKELEKLPAGAAVAPYAGSTAAEVLAFVDRLLGTPAAAGDGTATAQSQLG